MSIWIHVGVWCMQRVLPVNVSGRIVAPDSHRPVSVSYSY
jgi:hypothetical protein